jgi:tRNA G37 N-methylase Trm5
LIPQKLRHNKILRQIGDHPYKLAPNNFPYNKLLKYLPNVKQFCLWSSIGSLSSAQIDRIIKTSYPDSEFFWYENLPKYRSVPEIWHYHVFVNVL